ncbi:MAG: fumarylacetoacetate hydrolase family protein [Thermomicrobiales bacterium]|nr:fumarylacetoacetate hydrolase family protein [Thermomicrobiales bacterium]
MPLCYYRPREAAHSNQILGWVDAETEQITPLDSSLADLLEMGGEQRHEQINDEIAAAGATIALRDAHLLPPVDEQEIWAAGVTYERSRDARMEESQTDDIYDRVYDAERPEVFFKAPAYRCVGPWDQVAIRHDSGWNVPEPELAVIIDGHGEVAGYTIGNDVSSRSIEGENPLYLPQAKVYTASCAMGPWIMLPHELPDPGNVAISMRIERDGEAIWSGETSTARMHRTLDDLVDCLFAALEFPVGVVLLTGTGLVPPAEFTLEPNDLVHIELEGIGTLTNHVRRLPQRQRAQ